MSGLSRRELLAGTAALPVVAAADPAVVKRHDQAVENYLKSQVTDPRSRWRGALADASGLHNPGTAGGCFEAFTAAFLHPGSKFHGSSELVQRMRLAAGHLDRVQHESGNIDLLITNFNSPPDTAFVVVPVAAAANLLRRAGRTELFTLVERFLKKAGAALATGGVHTPNHRWVVCGALAQIHELFPDASYLRRIDQWLAEGIDIDEDGQYTERSTTVYNPICDRAFVTMAAKLNRPELLDPVRRNLDAMLYLLHPGYEVVTEISRRQDQYERGDMGRYWFPLRYLAVKDGNGQYALLADHFAAGHAGLANLMEYPELSAAGPAVKPVPEDYERLLPALGIARIRRGLTSATLVMGGSSRFLALRRGAAVINAVRFASAFFGKAQFRPTEAVRRGGIYDFRQLLEGPYYQPLDPPRKVRAGEWESSRRSRRRSEICRLEQAASVREVRNGFEVRVRAAGTDWVPLAIEISLRDGGQLEGCVPVEGVAGAWILPEGSTAVYRAGGDTIRFGPGLRSHSYTQVRGAEPKVPGLSVYLCGYTPVDHTIRFEL